MEPGVATGGNQRQVDGTPKPPEQAKSVATDLVLEAVALTPVLCRACRSLLHPWIVRRVGVHGRATVIGGVGAQFVVPGFVAVDLT